jgi:15-cis-phytoene synthase
MNAVYAFCRQADDIVDDESATIKNKQIRLDNYRAELSEALSKGSKNSLFQELNTYITQFSIPKEPFFDLIDGMEIDISKNRYETFDDLKNYCYKVASTVGLMTIPIFGYKNRLTKEYAINLGIALQLTNIIRDVKTDALIGRIYLPLEDLKLFGYSEQDLFNNLYNDKFIDLMNYQSNRAREFYRLADRNLLPEDKSPMFTARAMQYIYYRLLDKIEQENFNIFDKKIRVSTFNKLFIALSVWLKYKMFS